MASTKIVFLLLPNFHLLDLAGADQVFYEAKDQGLDIQIEYCTFECNIQSSAGLSLGNLRDFSEIALHSGDFVLIPGVDVKYLLSFEMRSKKAVLDWIRSAYQRNVHICSICTGAFVLGLAGLLDHKKCTTHWKRTKELKIEFPLAKVAENILFTEDDGIFTSAGVASGIDLALFIVSRLKDELLAYQVARELVLYTRRMGHDSQQSIYLSHRNHIHTGIHQVQDWLHENLHKKANLEDLSDVACMSSRSLTRIFRRETGITIHEYTTMLRKERAKELVKKPDFSRRKIAGLCGLQSERQLGRLLGSLSK